MNLKIYIIPILKFVLNSSNECKEININKFTTDYIINMHLLCFFSLQLQELTFFFLLLPPSPQLYSLLSMVFLTIK